MEKDKTDSESEYVELDLKSRYKELTDIVSQLSIKEVSLKLAEAITQDLYPNIEILWKRYKELKSKDKPETAMIIHTKGTEY